MCVWVCVCVRARMCVCARIYLCVGRECVYRYMCACVLSFEHILCFFQQKTAIGNKIETAVNTYKTDKVAQQFIEKMQDSVGPFTV